MVKTKMMLMKLLMMILRVNAKFVYECTSFRTVSDHDDNDNESKFECECSDRESAQ
jgi:hypothetical protein